MSAVAALAVASPAAVVAVSELSESIEPPTQHREFVQAAMVTDLPNELISALSQGLSQFGINLPPMPTGMLTGSAADHADHADLAGLHLGLTSPPDVARPDGTGADHPRPRHVTGLTTPGLATDPLATPGLAVTDPPRCPPQS